MSNLATRTYCPRTGSIAAQAIQHFQKNLSAKLSPAELGMIFKVDNKNIYSLLQTAVEAGFIAHEKGYFTAGDDIDQAPDYGSVAQADATIKAAGHAPGAAHSPFAHVYKATPPAERAKRQSPNKQPLPHPAAITLDDDVPLTPGRVAPVDWAALLTRMQPGQSAALPRSAKATLSKAVTEWHKAKPEVFTIRRMTDEQIRIWRTI